MRVQDSSRGMSTSNGVGVKFPDYLQNPSAGQSTTSGGGNMQSWADKNRRAFAESLGLEGVTGMDGRLDAGKTIAGLTKFCA